MDDFSFLPQNIPEKISHDNTISYEKIILKKICTKCGELKPLDCFCDNSKTQDGKHYWCKECSKKNTTHWRKNEKNKRDVFVEMFRELHQTFTEEQLKIIKKYYPDYNTNDEEYMEF